MCPILMSILWGCIRKWHEFLIKWVSYNPQHHGQLPSIPDHLLESKFILSNCRYFKFDLQKLIFTAVIGWMEIAAVLGKIESLDEKYLVMKRISPLPRFNITQNCFHWIGLWTLINVARFYDRFPRDTLRYYAGKRERIIFFLLYDIR